MNQRTHYHPQNQTALAPTSAPEEGVKIDGLKQVVDLLKNADPAFRESLLKRLGARDPKLAQSLKRFVR